MSTEVAIPRQKKPNDHTTDSFADLLASDLEWCADIVLMRLKLYLGQECVYQDITHLPPALPEGTSPYAEFLKQHSLNFEERLLLVLSLVPHLRPQLLDFFLVKNTSYDREFTEFGGVLEAPHKGFLPTGETALFLLAGKDLHKRLACGYLFGQNHLFATKNILSLAHTNTQRTLSGPVYRLTETGSSLSCRFSCPSDFHGLELGRPCTPRSHERRGDGDPDLDGTWRNLAPCVGIEDAHQTWLPGNISRPAGNRKDTHRHVVRQNHRQGSVPDRPGQDYF